jgi:fructuronate reductase
LFDRFANPNIRHRLAQIAADGSQKVPIRALPVLRAARADGELPSGATRFLAAWIAHLRGHGAPVQDVEAAALTELAQGPVREAVAAVLEWLGVDDLEVSALVEQQVADLEARSPSS